MRLRTIGFVTTILASAWGAGCSSSSGNGGFVGSGGSANTGGATATGGNSATGGATSSGGAPASGGADGTAGVTGASGGGSAANGGAAAGGRTNAGGAPAAGGATTAAGGAGGGDATAMMSPGCGMMPTQAAGQYVKVLLTVPGQPAASMSRMFYVRLPNNYDRNKAYPTVYLGPGCGVAQDSMPTMRKGLPFETNMGVAAATGAILVQMEPGFYNPAQYNSGTCVKGAPATSNNACAYCFDDWAYLSTIPDGVNGVVAIERAYFDTLHKTIEASFCVDKTRQFFAGYSSGGWMAQQLGCWFPDVLRAQANVTGGLAPPILTNITTGGNNYCVKHPIAAMAIHDFLDTSNVYQGTVDGMRRLFALNGCTGTFAAPPNPSSTSAMPAGLVPYTITGLSAAATVFKCYQYSTCPAATPMVFCVSNDSMHNDQAARAVPGFWQFFSKF